MTNLFLRRPFDSSSVFRFFELFEPFEVSEPELRFFEPLEVSEPELDTLVFVLFGGVLMIRSVALSMRSSAVLADSSVFDIFFFKNTFKCEFSSFIDFNSISSCLIFNSCSKYFSLKKVLQHNFNTKYLGLGSRIYAVPKNQVRPTSLQNLLQHIPSKVIGYYHSFSSLFLRTWMPFSFFQTKPAI